MRPVPAIFMLLAVLAVGCATQPPAPLLTPAPSPSMTNGFASRVERPFPKAWWTTFCDPDLDRLVAQALAENRDLGQAAARLEAAQARAKLAGADSALHVTGTGNARRQRSSENTDSAFAPTYLNRFGANLQFAYEADLWGRIKATRLAALKNVELSSQELAATEITLTAEVAKDHLRRLALRREADVLEQQIVTFSEVETLLTIRLEAGFATELDLQRVRIEKGAREVEQARVREQEQALTYALAQLCGQAPEVSSTNGALREAVTPHVPATLSLELLESRPDVAAQRAKWESAFQRVQAARMAFYPSLQLSGTIGVEAKSVEDLVDWQSRLWALVAGLTAPLLDGGRLEASLEIERAALHEAAAGYESAVLTAYREVADALNTLHALDVQQIAAEAVLEASQRALDLSRERYKRGFVSYLEVVESDRSLLAAKRTLIQVQAGRQTATVDPIRALGLP